MILGENYGELWGDAYFPREEQKVLGARNLLDVVSSAHTANGTMSGVTIATNSDGTITFTTPSTASANVDYVIGTADGRLKLSDYPSNIILSKGSSVSSQKLLMQVWYYDSSKNYTGFQNESGSGEGEFLLQPQSGDVYFAINFCVISGKSVNTTIKPMIRLASDSDGSYTPYAMTNKQLTDAVKILRKSFTGSTNTSSDGFYNVALSLTDIPFDKIVGFIITGVTGARWASVSSCFVDNGVTKLIVWSKTSGTSVTVDVLYRA